MQKTQNQTMESFKYPLTAFFFFFIVALSVGTITAVDPCKSSQSDGSHLSVIPIYSKCSPFSKSTSNQDSSPMTTVINMASKDPLRLKYLSASAVTAAAPVASGQQLHIGNYIVRAKLGTPGQLLFMVLDTSSDAAWAPCSGCSGCSSSAAAAAAAFFSPNSSSTFSPLDCSLSQCTQVRGLTCTTTGQASTPCQFNRTYGGDSSFSATLAQDTLTLSAAAVVPNFAFGCITSAAGTSLPPQGLLGLGRGPMSLVSQSGQNYSGVFSYCLPSFKSYYFSGSLRLGPAGQPKNIRTTPMLRNPHRPSLYYVNLTGISVGRVSVPIPPELLAFDPNTGSGTIIDSGTVITRFVPGVYEAVRDEFRRQVKGPFSSLGAFDTCFEPDGERSAPVVTLMFEGLDLKLPVENSLIHSTAGTVACLSMAAAPSNVFNVIANLQQQNLRILFDVANSRIGIARELCN